MMIRVRLVSSNAFHFKLQKQGVAAIADDWPDTARLCSALLLLILAMRCNRHSAHHTRYESVSFTKGNNTEHLQEHSVIHLTSRHSGRAESRYFNYSGTSAKPLSGRMADCKTVRLNTDYRTV